MRVEISLELYGEAPPEIKWGDIDYNDVILTAKNDVLIKTYSGWVSLKNPRSTWGIGTTFHGAMIGKLTVVVGSE